KLCRKNPDFRQLAITEGFPEPLHKPDSIGIVTTTQLGSARYELGIKADGPGLIVSSIPAVPGWRLKVNNTSRVPATVNSAFIGIPVKRGDALVELRYRPGSFTLGLVLCLVGLVVLAYEGVLSQIHRARKSLTTS
ncbi:MAG: hypothetical protein DRJ65_22595, partial [Acidobacteria bacterium]